MKFFSSSSCRSCRESEMPCLLLLFFLLFFLPSHSNATSPFIHSIGAILDSTSRAGKEEKTAMEMAREDLFTSNRFTFHLYINNSQQDPIHAASAAMDLINKKRVQAILGMQTWQETAIVADLGKKARVPVLSLVASTPPSASDRWPFLIPVGNSRCAQIKAISAIVGSWQWRRVTVIHEYIDYVASGIISCLGQALHEVGSDIEELALPPLASSLSDELKKLKIKQCRVFIVHTSLELATRIFSEAKHMGMMEADSVWIATQEITSFLDFVNASVISSMQGLLGVKGYFPKNRTRFSDFQLRFRRRFRLEHPEEENPAPGVFALRAYDAVWAVAIALERMGANAKQNQPSSDPPKEIEISANPEMKLKVSADGQNLLQTILLSDFEGLSGEFRFVNGSVIPPNVFEVVNVVGKSYRELGFWSKDYGFSDVEKRRNSSSMEILGQIYWPGGPWTVPRGWAPPTGERTLKIGVPANSAFSEFVRVNYNSDQTVKNVTGFCIEVFEAVRGHLPYDLKYRFVAFNGSYDSLIQQVQLKAFDAVVGDTSIVANRCDHVEFSQPYAEPGLVMVISVKSMQTHEAWLFMKPFSKTMWALTALTNVYNGFVVWLIELRLREEAGGSPWNKLGTVLWFSFTTLFSLHREDLGSNLARMAMVVWLFVALILTQSYTANLSSMLILRGLDSGIADVQSLKRINAAVGCDNGSFVGKYLEEVLGFQRNKIKQYTSGDDYLSALKGQEISAAFLRVPYAKVLVAKYCGDLTIAGPTFEVGGFGFAFPKGSPLIPDVSKAILQVFERGKIKELENDMVSSYKCSSSASDDKKTNGLSYRNFLGLFGITAGISSIALLIFVLRLHRKNCSSVVSSLATATKETAQALGSALVKCMKGVRERLLKKKKSNNSTDKGQAHNTEMT